MSNDNEELIDYEDDQDVIANGTASASTRTAPAADGDKEKKNFSGIHSTGFRFVPGCILKPPTWN
jgi:ATP-dependent RNA helicase UAP56/SUB2